MGAVTLLGFIATAVYWEFSSSRRAGIPPHGAFECRALYEAAATASETIRVDLTHPTLGRQEDPNPPTCGTLRRLGELDADDPPTRR